jgi:hypothetical protein
VNIPSSLFWSLIYFHNWKIFVVVVDSVLIVLVILLSRDLFVLVFQIGLAILGIIVVVAVVNFWLLIPTFFVGVTFYLLRIVYLSTSRSVKRLEGLSKCQCTDL